MPNHIQNKLELIGSPSAVRMVFDFMAGTPYDDGTPMKIDFSKIIPKPDELDITSDNWLMPLDNQFSREDFKTHLVKLRESNSKNPDSAEERTKNFIQGVSNFIKYGHATWYSWSVEHWGTKWNAYEQGDERDNDTTIYFQTAWSSALLVVAALSKKFPEIDFLFSWADEDAGANTGIVKFVMGNRFNAISPVNYSNEAYYLYFDLHPEHKKNYELVKGEWKYKDED